MCLIDLKGGETVVIESINAGTAAQKRLADLGVSVGKEIKALNVLLYGPVQIEISGSSLILGHGIASKIIVK